MNSLNQKFDNNNDIIMDIVNNKNYPENKKIEAIAELCKNNIFDKENDNSYNIVMDIINSEKIGENCKVKIIDELCKNKIIDANAKNNVGHTILVVLLVIIQEKMSVLEYVKCLLKNGADPNLKSDGGQSPWWCLAKKYSRDDMYEIIYYLGECGMNLGYPNCNDVYLNVEIIEKYRDREDGLAIALYISNKLGIHTLFSKKEDNTPEKYKEIVEKILAIINKENDAVFLWGYVALWMIQRLTLSKEIDDKLKELKTQKNILCCREILPEEGKKICNDENCKIGLHSKNKKHMTSNALNFLWIFSDENKNNFVRLETSEILNVSDEWRKENYYKFAYFCNKIEDEYCDDKKFENKEKCEKCIFTLFDKFKEIKIFEKMRSSTFTCGSKNNDKFDIIFHGSISTNLND